MVLDSTTLGAAFVLLAIVLGTLLLFAWTLNRKVRALGWWGAAFCLVAIGIGLANLGRQPPNYPVLLVANALVTLAYGALYTGCRTFNGRPRALSVGLAGTAVWIAAFAFIYDQQAARLVLLSVIVAIYAALSARELWKNAPQRLASQGVAVALLVGLVLFNLLRAVLGISSSSIAWLDAFASRWSAGMALILVVYGPTLAFIFLSMAKERVEFDYKQAAFIDPLTGIPNRRAFLQNAAALLRRLGDRPASCLLFDLDNFKSFNDRYGHDVGDRILTAFGETLAKHLPKQTFGRIGGEEFAAILPLGESEAVGLAEAIRHTFAAAGEAVPGIHGDVTVSVGCVSAANVTVKELLRRADAGLYQAKANGRNVVVTAAPSGEAELGFVPEGPDPAPSLMRTPAQ